MATDILDCETLKSKTESVCTLLRITAADLSAHIDFFVANPPEVRTNQVEDRWLPMVNRIGEDRDWDEESGQTMWFHATRVDDFSCFRTGVRAVREQIDHTWSFLYTLARDVVSEAEWRRFRRQVERDNYGHSPEVHRAWMSDGGPCAFLFGETSLNPAETGNHDYLGVSELVDFIAECFKRTFSADLRERHRAATQPCLVKFSTAGISKIYIGAAIDYLVYRKAGHALCCLDPCFSASGISISAGQVSKVIPVHEAPRRGLEPMRSYRATAPEFHLHQASLNIDADPKNLDRPARD